MCCDRGLLLFRKHFFVISIICVVFSTSGYSQETKLEPESRFESGYILAVPLQSGNLQIQICDPKCDVFGNIGGYSPQWLAYRSHQLMNRTWETGAAGAITIPLATLGGIALSLVAYSTSPAWAPVTGIVSLVVSFIGTSPIIDMAVGAAAGLGTSTYTSLRYFNPWSNYHASKSIQIGRLQSGKEVVFPGTLKDFKASLKYALQIKN